MFQSWQQVIKAADRVTPPPGGREKKSATQPISSRKKPTVLVVDDERLIADTMKEILSLAGFNALCAYDGSTALAIAMKTAPDYILTDVVMPVMNGIELAISIRKAMPETKIVLLSGQAGITNLLDEAREQGFTFELLAKPIHPEKLLAQLKKR